MVNWGQKTSNMAVVPYVVEESCMINTSDLVRYKSNFSKGIDYVTRNLLIFNNL